MKFFKNLVLVAIASMVSLNAEAQTTVYTESGTSYTITEPSLVCPADALPDDPSCVAMQGDEPRCLNKKTPADCNTCRFQKDCRTCCQAVGGTGCLPQCDNKRVE